MVAWASHPCFLPFWGLIWGAVKGKHLPAPQNHCPQVGLRVVPSTKGLPQGLSLGKLCSPFCAPAGFPILVHAFLRNPYRTPSLLFLPGVRTIKPPWSDSHESHFLTKNPNIATRIVLLVLAWDRGELGACNCAAGCLGFSFLF